MGVFPPHNKKRIYGEVEEHAAPAAGGLPGDTEKKTRRKILTDPKEVRAFMRNTCRKSTNIRKTSPLKLSMWSVFWDQTKTKMF